MWLMVVSVFGVGRGDSREAPHRAHHLGLQSHAAAKVEPQDEPARRSCPALEP